MRVFFSLLLMALTFNLLAATPRSLPLVRGEIHSVDKLDLSQEELNYFSISSVTIEEVATPLIWRPDEGDKGTLDDISMRLDKLIALGKKVWAIVEKNKPVVNTDFMAAISVIPEVQGGSDPSTTFALMSGWSTPKAKTFRITYKNLLGMSVIQFDYTVTFQYGGQYNGVGRYLTGVNVFANSVAVDWGFTFNAKTSLVTISNLGSLENPIAGATLKVEYKADSVLRSISATAQFHVTGDGQLKELQ